MTECLHESRFILEDFSNGSLVCTNCGMVLENLIFGRVSQEVELFVSEPSPCKYYSEFKDMACMLNLKDDAVELAINLYDQYTINKREKKILVIIFLYYASRMLEYSIDMKNFKMVFDNKNLGSINSDKKFNAYLGKIDMFFKRKFKNFEEIDGTTQKSSNTIFNYYFELFLPFYKLNKLKYQVTISDYSKIIEDFMLKRADVSLVSKSQYNVFLVCFINQLEKFNLSKDDKQEICNYFNVNMNSLKTIDKIYRALNQKF